MEFIKFGEEKLPSVINDPFSKNCVTDITVYFRQHTFDKTKWSATGIIEFTNGSTSGKHKFTGDTFDDVVLQIKSAIKSL